jgi:hypothetical protein
LLQSSAGTNGLLALSWLAGQFTILRARQSQQFVYRPDSLVAGPVVGSSFLSQTNLGGAKAKTQLTY